jgi:hypothetical protein
LGGHEASFERFRHPLAHAEDAVATSYTRAFEQHRPSVGLMENKLVTRREFLDTLAVGAAGLAMDRPRKELWPDLGSNDRLNFAVIGLNGSRAYAHLSSLKANKDAARISHVCDVDSNT